MLGSSIMDKLKDRFSLHGLTRADMQLDNYHSVNSRIATIKPDVIIHCAAYTNVELAESDVSECYRVNFAGTQNIANAARNAGSKLIYISSTGCYGSYSELPYCEYDDVNPTTVYHRSKVAGEECVKSICSDYLILRTGWLYGGAITHKKNFVFNRFMEAKQVDKMVSDPFQRGNPTRVDEVADQIQTLIDHDVCGIFNVVSEGSCSRFEYVQAIITLCGLKTVIEKANVPFKRLAAVSPNEAASNFLLQSMGLSVMKPWKEGLKQYIDTHILSTTD